jgi:hypothetical protein
MAHSLWVLDWDYNAIPTNTHLIQYLGIGLLGQSNPTFFDTWYQKNDPIKYIGQKDWIGFIVAASHFTHYASLPAPTTCAYWTI